ncbi:thiamine phosphate synthase [Flavobacterium sp. WLB]|uniref:thiamine phosphate synthase n=1 Tax=Flavobacterium TaxID=237 RepID=UPI0006ABABBC|nr:MULTISPECIES: thiamine phosphate synthase [Flavobacterium]KOP37630.1 thiamine monophosphate synthase [Flavobacterium sp. VMW]OWU91259.1 thiamine monophosphate synthase [Flavobacterium sp. NLM]PUU71304.1 thiamine phosphate synthase [Flavobacterium sp. WLB]UUF16144.1 thiamine phosphate synthase [Flavobacterium panici]
MIVITNPFFIEDEIRILHSLFEEGLSLLHLRKPDFSELEMAQFIHQIKIEFRDRIVLHNYHLLAEDFGISRIHFSEKEKKRIHDFPARFPKPCRYNFSTSTHSIEDFNSLENDFDYAFLSPVFKSISKENYEPKIDLFEALKSRTNYKTKVIALGGIDSQNIQKTMKNGFDDIALLGTIWNNENPIKQFKLCQQIVLSYLQSQV